MTDKQDKPPRDKWTPDEALAEFEYACRTWTACMLERGEHRDRAIAAANNAILNVGFDPRTKPRC